MRKNVFLMFAILSLTVFLFGCSSNDDIVEDIGKNNKTDVAVTGGVIECGRTYAIIKGYCNLDKLPSSVKCKEFGVQICLKETFDRLWGKEGDIIKKESLQEDNHFEVGKGGLWMGETYYYRTYVLGNDDITRYGETRSFTTTNEKFDNVLSVDSVAVSYTKVDMTFSIDKSKFDNKYDFSGCGIALSESRQNLQKDSIKQGKGVSSIHLDSYKEGTCTLKSFKQNTKYYYCGFTYIQGKDGVLTYALGDIKSFETKSRNIVTSGYVDLGLPSGTKWNACNHGTSNPKYGGPQHEWYYISENNLSAPSYTQMKELLEECTWESWDSDGDVYLVIGKNGNAIFVTRYMWSSTEESTDNAYSLTKKEIRITKKRYELAIREVSR